VCTFPKSCFMLGYVLSALPFECRSNGQLGRAPERWRHSKSARAPTTSPPGCTPPSLPPYPPSVASMLYELCYARAVLFLGLLPAPCADPACVLSLSPPLRLSPYPSIPPSLHPSIPPSLPSIPFTKKHMLPSSLNAHSGIINTITCARRLFAGHAMHTERLLANCATHPLRYIRCVSYAASPMILMTIITTTLGQRPHPLAKGRISISIRDCRRKPRGLLLNSRGLLLRLLRLRRRQHMRRRHYLVIEAAEEVVLIKLCDLAGVSRD
jgi:hypothetical protein